MLKGIVAWISLPAVRSSMSLAAILCIFVNGAVLAAFVPGQSGVISFQSVTPATYGDLVFRTYSMAPVTISGTLSLPAGAASPVPAVIVRHSCDGVKSGEFSWAQTLNEMGVAAFVLDSYTGRGISSTCTGQQTLPGAADLADAFKALELLATHPGIDPNRIGILGRSAGGRVALQVAFEEFRKGIIQGDLKFAAHVALYPGGCNARVWSPNMSGGAVLSLLGESDDYTPAHDCTLYSEIMASLGTDVTTVVYPGAYHTFDSQRAVTWIPDVRTQRACAGEFRVDTFEFRRYDTGQIFSNGTQYAAYLESCRQVGATVGGNPAALLQARVDIGIFLARVLALPLVLPQSQPDRIFNWAEATFPQYLQPAGAASRTWNDYYYRYYRNTNVFIAVRDGRFVYYMPSVDPNTVGDLGAEADFLNQAGQAGY